MTTLGIEYEQPSSEDRGLRQGLLGGLALVVLSGAGWWANSVEQRLSAAHERLAAVESGQKALEQRFEIVVQGIKEGEIRLHAQISRQEEKLDSIMELLVKERQAQGYLRSTRFDK